MSFPLRFGMVLATVVCLMVCIHDAIGQTTKPTTAASQPARASHEELVRLMAKEPLIKEEYRSASGQPLAEDQIAEIEKANKLLESAEKAKSAGDYTAAAEAADKALATYRQLLGDTHHRTVSAAILRRTLDRIAAASQEDQKRIAEADKSQAAAEAAHEKGDFAQALKDAQQCLQIREKLLGKDHADVGVTLRVLGNEQTELGRLPEAEESLNQASKVSESTYGPEHPRTALVLDRLGWLKINQGKYDEAVQTLARAVRIFRNTVGETAELAEALDNLGTALNYSRDFDRALKSKLRAYVIREKALGPEARDTGVSISNLAWLYAQTGLGSKEEILSLRKRALAIFEHALGPDHPWTLLEKGNLGREYAMQGMLPESVKLFEEMVARDQTHPDVLSDRVADRLISLGGLYLQAERVDDAQRCLTRAGEIVSALHDKGDVRAAITEGDTLTNVYLGGRQFEEAVKIAEAVRSWAEKASQKPDEESVNRLVRLGSAYRDVGRLEDARQVLERALKDARDLRERDDLRNVGLLLSLSSVQEKLGRLDEAEDLCDQALRITEAKLPRGARGQAYALTAVGRVQALQKRTDLARFSLEEARKILEREENRRADPAGPLNVLQNLALCQMAAGKKEEAVELHRQAMKQCRKITENAKGVAPKALLASSMKQLLDVLQADLPASQKECDALKAELRQVLESLQAFRALSEENKQWLKELGGAKEQAKP
jgi:tetratricopeptide (TPR) repeat protein